MFSISSKEILLSIIAFCLLLFACAPPKDKVKQDAINAKNKLNFSGYEWDIKNTTKRVGPGNNYFSSSTDNVWVDQEGHLNLKISQQNNRWQCAEVISKQHFGYGLFEFFVAARTDKFDKNTVLGLFTYDKKLKPHYNEIDIEFSKWGNNTDTNSQYVVHHNQNYFESKRFKHPTGLKFSTHIILRNKDSIYFASYEGHYRNALKSRKPYQSWTYKNSFNPKPVNEKIHINLWLFRATPLTAKKEEIISIYGFWHTSKD